MLFFYLKAIILRFFSMKKRFNDEDYDIDKENVDNEDEIKKYV